MSKKHQVISPDGFSIENNDGYDTLEAAREAFELWKSRYTQQGYYSSNRGRIPLDELEDYCSIK